MESEDLGRKRINGLSNGKMNYWDIFRKDVSENEKEKASGATDTLLRVLKVVAYLVFFVLVFGGSIVTKASLQILTNEFNKENKSRFSMVVKECLHMFCLGIIVFLVMPKLNSIEVCAFLAGMPLVPSILHTISYRRKCTKRFCKQILNILSILLQAAAVCAVPLYKSFKDQITTEETFWMIFSSVLVSVRWFETYFKYSSTSRVFKTLFAYENRIETHCASTLVTSFCRLLLIIVLFPTYFAQNIHRPEIAFEMKPELHIECSISQLNSTRCTHYADPSLMTPFLVHFFVCMGLYYAAVLATKVCMDRICFCVALALGAPVYVGIIVISRVTDNWISNTFIKDVDNMDLYVMVAIFVIAWLSQLWICRHIWYSPHNRLTFEYKLFVLPHYCSPIADISLLHSRRIVSGTTESKKYEESIPTKVYICATMWHENRTEMKQIMKTLFRLDMDQAAREIAKYEVKVPTNRSLFGSKLDKDAINRDYYKFEAHILFDDAMETIEGKREPNEFVKQLMEIVTEAGTDVYKIPINMLPPDKVVTPYGGRLNYTLPGENKLVVHLKDKDKIRHKKRWSQIMYMYYLLGYKLVEKEISSPLDEDFESASSLFQALPKDIVQQAENTYVMALDGDVDFSPKALQLLIDRMKKNPKVGATCGRIKPGGSGPVVWYQKFEYAIGHWLQKSAEHVFGCVLCSPGCFSLFRAKALMDDNIMRTYASMPTEPKHYLQYDQGEDRWLCTLMLQQGYRIEYCAAAEAVTFAPEEFREFFNQRRRWMPSTMANILDLLISYKRTTRNNSNISYLYIFYQWILFLSSILGPSLVLLAMRSAISSVFKDSVSPWVAYLLIYGPTLVFIFICLKCKTQTQLTVAMALSAIYAMFMMAVLVGTIVNIAEEGIFTPTAVFMYVLIGIFLIAGLFHPHELTDLFWGLLYFVCIPAGYLFLIVYAICNLNNVSWGTRETQTAVLEQQFDGKQRRKKKTEEEFGVVSEDILDDILKQIKTTKVKNASYTDLIPSYFQWHNNLVLLRSLESVQNIVKNTESTVPDDGSDLRQTRRKRVSLAQTIKDKPDSESVDDTSWAEDHGQTKELQDDEKLFWKDLILNYLKPIDSDKKREKEIARSLKEYRDKVAFAFFFVNALWVVVMSAMNEVKGQLNIKIPAIGSNTVIEPLGLMFLSIFALLLFMQFIGMIRHRYGTLLHVLSATTLRQTQGNPESIINRIKDISSISPASEPEFVTTKLNHVGESGASDTSTVDMEEIDQIYENIYDLRSKKKNELGKSVKRPTAHLSNMPFDLKKTFRTNVKTMKRQHKGNKRYKQKTTENKV
ncbi:chitin synthase [Mytilus galloprovincialis]|uniref:chitin synthase n=1 Tax=Mytilus galloprovincialis TaxID=29158 RepID=A0A8B6F4Q6_MYTGA|nr:chitin synthase [Mytilus galloprovincialis]